MKWFWHNPVVDLLERGLVSLTNIVWKKRREAEKEAITKIKQQESAVKVEATPAASANNVVKPPTKTTTRKRAPRSK